MSSPRPRFTVVVLSLIIAGLTIALVVQWQVQRMSAFQARVAQPSVNNVKMPPRIFSGRMPDFSELKNSDHLVCNTPYRAFGRIELGDPDDPNKTVVITVVEETNNEWFCTLNHEIAQLPVKSFFTKNCGKPDKPTIEAIPSSAINFDRLVSQHYNLDR